MSTYTVKAIMPTGNSSEKYGTEFYVQFDETDLAPALWFKKSPQPGDPIEGEIENGKFKKVKKEWKPSLPAETGGPVNTPQTYQKAPYKDNSDGMRQGMCINNAANYVNSLEFEKPLTDREWAKTVHSYATALYILGDLKNQDAENVAAVFTEAE